MFFPAYTIGDTIEIEQSNPMVRLFGVVKRVMLKNRVDVVYDVEVEVGAERGLARGLNVMGTELMVFRTYVAGVLWRRVNCEAGAVLALSSPRLWDASRHEIFGRRCSDGGRAALCLQLKIPNCANVGRDYPADLAVPTLRRSTC
jgi:hypothetical protein